jgi:hypothetical protein
MRIIHLAFAVLLAACTAGPRASAAEPERVVQASYDAFNRRDVEGILAAYAPDAVFISPPADTMPLDTGDLRGFYERQFELLPRMRLEVRERRVTGRTVVDEVVTHDGPCKGPDTGTITYEVVDGRIRSITEAPPREERAAVSIAPGWHVSCPVSAAP